MSSNVSGPRPPAAPSLEQITKIWINLPDELSSATSTEMQELNESCCFCLEQVNTSIIYPENYFFFEKNLC